MLSTQELTSLSPKELIEELKKARRSLLNIRMQLKTNQSKAIHDLKKYKSYVARILTIMNELKSAGSLELVAGRKENNKET